MAATPFLTTRPLPSELRSSPLDSARFGCSIGRLEVGGSTCPPVEEVLAIVDAADLDLVVYRYPSDWVEHFGDLARRRANVIHADTVVYYRRLVAPVSARTDRTTHSGRWRLAGGGDQPAVAALVRACFAGYRNHYAAAPGLATVDVVEGYVEWALSHLDSEDGLLVIELDANDQAIAFAAVGLGDDPEIALAAVHPSRRGAGVYHDLLDVVAEELSDRGCSHVWISTQVHNSTPIRAWTRSEFTFEFAVQTVHLWRAGPPSMPTR